MEQNEIGDQTHPEDVGGIQSFFVLERDASGKLTPESMAGIAIQGMLPGKVADEAEALEKRYQEWLKSKPADAGLGLWDRLAVKLALPALEAIIEQEAIWTNGGLVLLRKQVALLALGYQESQNKLRQMEVQRAFYDQYLLMQEGNTKFRAFLLENFPEEMKVADATNQPLIQFAQGLMLQLKSKQQ